MMAPQLSQAFDELSLKIHGDKTVVVVPGMMKAAREMREELTMFPMVIQDNKIKVVESDLYLGMIIHEGGVKASVLRRQLSQEQEKPGARSPLSNHC